MGVGAGLYMYDVVVKKFTFAISSLDEFLFDNLEDNLHYPSSTPHSGDSSLLFARDIYHVLYILPHRHTNRFRGSRRSNVRVRCTEPLHLQDILNKTATFS